MCKYVNKYPELKNEQIYYTVNGININNIAYLFL